MCTNLWCWTEGVKDSLEYTDITKVFFTPHHVGHCCTVIVEQQYPWGIVALMLLDVIVEHNVFKQLSRSHCCAKMVLRVACRLGKRNRQIDRLGLVHKVFFAHARAWRTPDNLTLQTVSSANFPQALHFLSLILSYFWERSESVGFDLWTPVMVQCFQSTNLCSVQIYWAQ
jgi:hypothetical protein